MTTPDVLPRSDTPQVPPAPDGGGYEVAVVREPAPVPKASGYEVAVVADGPVSQVGTEAAVETPKASGASARPRRGAPHRPGRFPGVRDTTLHAKDATVGEARVVTYPGKGKGRDVIDVAGRSIYDVPKPGAGQNIAGAGAFGQVRLEVRTEKRDGREFRVPVAVKSFKAEGDATAMALQEADAARTLGVGGVEVIALPGGEVELIMSGLAPAEALFTGIGTGRDVEPPALLNALFAASKFVGWVETLPDTAAHGDMHGGNAVFTPTGDVMGCDFGNVRSGRFMPQKLAFHRCTPPDFLPAYIAARQEAAASETGEADFTAVQSSDVGTFGMWLLHAFSGRDKDDCFDCLETSHALRAYAHDKDPGYGSTENLTQVRPDDREYDRASAGPGRGSPDSTLGEDAPARDLSSGYEYTHAELQTAPPDASAERRAEAAALGDAFAAQRDVAIEACIEHLNATVKPPPPPMVTYHLKRFLKGTLPKPGEPRMGADEAAGCLSSAAHAWTGRAPDLSPYTAELATAYGT